MTHEAPPGRGSVEVDDDELERRVGAMAVADDPDELPFVPPPEFFPLPGDGDDG